ncbi:hypothetical protein, partial [Pseudohongiella acticola]|uniref:hypothetical protein n=1 Tax=Pseudohongiella acticola TaxID=1524254 RepID=UPI0030ECD805
PAATVFELGGGTGTFDANFGANSYRVGGRFTTAAAGSGAGGGGTPPGQVATETVESTGTAAAAANNAITTGTAEEAQSALNTAASSLETLATAVTGGATLSTEQQAAVQANVQTVFSNVVTLIGKVQNDPVKLAAAVTTLNRTLTAMKNASVPATAAIVSNVVTAGRASASAAALANSGISAENATDAQIAAALGSNGAALEATLRQSIQIPPTSVQTPQQKQTAISTSTQQRGAPNTNITSSAFPPLEVVTVPTASCTDPAPIWVGGFNIGGSACGLKTPVELPLADDRVGGVLAVVAEGTATIKADEVSGVLTIQLPGEAYAGYTTASRAVPASVPTGIRILRNGTASIINAGYAMELAPVPVDTVGFALAVTQAGYSDLTFSSDDGAYRIDFGNGQRFAGVFAYDNLSGKTLDFNCGGTTIVEPTIAPTAPGYSFGINCANGVQQRMVPYMDNTSFFASLETAKIPYSVDRNTGIITSEGNGRFKPSFFVSTRTAAETAFHTGNKDANGIAFQAIDVNGDGRIDFKVIGDNGTQVLYGVN